MSFIDKDTAEMPALRADSDAFFSDVSSSFVVTVGARTDRGKRRDENQDHHAVMRRTRSQQILLSDGLLKPGLEAEEEAYVLMVADGMGGAAFGEYASRLVIQTLWELTARATSWVTVSVRWVRPSLVACSRIRVVTSWLIRHPPR